MKRFLMGLLTLAATGGWGVGQAPKLQERKAAPVSQLADGASTKSSAPSMQAPAHDGGDKGDGFDCPPACPACPDESCRRFWVEGDYLLWWLKGDRLPPLVTTSPDGTPRAAAGVLGAPGTTILFGDSSPDAGVHSGGRFTVGYWLDCCQTCGVEANFFFLENRGTFFQAGSPGSPILARPFFNTTTGMQDSQLVAFPGVLAGNIHVTDKTDNVLGAEALGRCNLCCSCTTRVDLLGGYRFARFDGGLRIDESLTGTGPGLVPIGTRIDVSDDFGVRNEFHGGELGGVVEWRRDHFSVGLRATVALGVNHEEVDINGSTRISTPGQPSVVNAGGLLALPTNIGHHQRDVFAVVPEFRVTAGYAITPHLRALIGYTFLYWSDAVRSGDQVDLSVNPTQIPPGMLSGTPRPAFSFHNSDFWAQGIHFGVELQF
jgi:hypothetical protein